MLAVAGRPGFEFARPESRTPRPILSFSRMNAQSVILYTRVGCHLCEDAKALLQRHGLAPSEVDIDQDPTLRARYDQCVPVVEIDGVERFRGQVNEVLLRRLVEHRGA